jgi:hypothetical protein
MLVGKILNTCFFSFLQIPCFYSYSSDTSKANFFGPPPKADRNIESGCFKELEISLVIYRDGFKENLIELGITIEASCVLLKA